jgi:hypothetical protein
MFKILGQANRKVLNKIHWWGQILNREEGISIL